MVPVCCCSLSVDFQGYCFAGYVFYDKFVINLASENVDFLLVIVVVGEELEKRLAGYDCAAEVVRLFCIGKVDCGIFFPINVFNV